MSIRHILMLTVLVIAFAILAPAGAVAGADHASWDTVPSALAAPPAAGIASEL